VSVLERFASDDGPVTFSSDAGTTTLEDPSVTVSSAVTRFGTKLASGSSQTRNMPARSATTGATASVTASPASQSGTSMAW
jgi:hypothetical protein